jgi:hypothetical protein
MLPTLQSRGAADWAEVVRPAAAEGKTIQRTQQDAVRLYRSALEGLGRRAFAPGSSTMTRFQRHGVVWMNLIEIVSCLTLLKPIPELLCQASYRRRSYLQEEGT